MATILTATSLKQWKQDQYNNQQGKCALCGLQLDSVGKANADHNHATGHMRGLLHPLCNSILEGKVAGLMYRAGLKGKADFPTVLRNLADYWEQDYSDQPIHPNYVNDTAKKFSKYTRERMIKELNDNGGDYDKTFTKEELIDGFKALFKQSLNNSVTN